MHQIVLAAAMYTPEDILLEDLAQALQSHKQCKSDSTKSDLRLKCTIVELHYRYIGKSYSEALKNLDKDLSSLKMFDTPNLS